MAQLINIVSFIIVIGLVIVSRKCIKLVKVGIKNKNLFYKEINSYKLISSITLIISVILSGVTFFRMLTQWEVTLYVVHSN